MTLSNKNRAVVKDGRLQVKKKRTDRSYLQSQPESPTAIEDVVDEAAPEAAAEPVETVAVTPPPEAPSTAPQPAATGPDPAATFTPPAPLTPVDVAAVAPAAAVKAAPVPNVGAARALQQQGVRKRREVDVHELARRDSSYAMHELRRIAILTFMVVVTLVVLGIVLR